MCSGGTPRFFVFAALEVLLADENPVLFFCSGAVGVVAVPTLPASTCFRSLVGMECQTALWFFKPFLFCLSVCVCVFAFVGKKRIGLKKSGIAQVNPSKRWDDLQR